MLHWLPSSYLAPRLILKDELRIFLGWSVVSHLSSLRSLGWILRISLRSLGWMPSRTSNVISNFSIHLEPHPLSLLFDSFRHLSQEDNLRYVICPSFHSENRCIEFIQLFCNLHILFDVCISFFIIHSSHTGFLLLMQLVLLCALILAMHYNLLYSYFCILDNLYSFFKISSLYKTFIFCRKPFCLL